MPVNLYYTQRIREFQQESVKYNGSSVRYSQKRTKFQCNHCGSLDVTPEPLGQRLVHGDPLGMLSRGNFRIYFLSVVFVPGAKHEQLITFHSYLIPGQE